MDASPAQSMLADVSRLKNGGVSDVRLRLELGRVEGMLAAAVKGDEIDAYQFHEALDDMRFAADNVDLDVATKVTLNAVYDKAPDAVMQLGDVSVEHSPGF